MLDSYTNFFIASAGASAAFIGLLFVALTVANNDEQDDKTRTRRSVLAGSSFAQLLDAFFVSIIGLIGGVASFAIVSLAMPIFGLLTTSRLLPRVIRAGTFARNAPSRQLNFSLPIVSILVYLLQLAFAVGVLQDPTSTTLIRWLVLIILGLYAGALVRAWEITRS